LPSRHHWRSAVAAGDEDLKVLREEVAQMKTYEQRIEALEQQLAAARRQG
jgi:phage shock protein A